MNCGKNELEKLIPQLQATGLAENQILPNREKFDAILEKIRQQGYAVRDLSFAGGQSPFRSQYDDGLEAIAVAFPYDGLVIIGCLTIAWIQQQAASVEMITQEYLKSL